MSGRGLVGPFRSRYDRNQSLRVRDVPYGLDTVNNEPVDTLGVRLQELSRHLDNRHNIMSAGNDMNLLDLRKLEQSVSNLRLLAQDSSHIDEGTNMPLHFTLRMIVSFNQTRDALKTAPSATPYNSLDKKHKLAPTRCSSRFPPEDQPSLVTNRARGRYRR